MWFYIFFGILCISCIAIYYIMKHQIEELIKKNCKLKYDNEDQILAILGDIKQIENKYATSGTEMCRYLDKAIAFHNSKYYKYKNELNIATNDNV